MFGDFEAQRHWMELTIHLPPREWYTYDLPYWGLDYPPLTAYASWLCGLMCVIHGSVSSVVTHSCACNSGAWLDPSSFSLYHSRGIESTENKVYMRATVVALDALIHLPALVMFVRIWLGNRSKRTQVFKFTFH